MWPFESCVEMTGIASPHPPEQVLEEKLPPGNPPAEGSEPAYSRWREELQRALVETFCDVSEDFACKGQLAGTTITVVLQVHHLFGATTSSRLSLLPCTISTLGSGTTLLNSTGRMHSVWHESSD